MSKKIGRVWPSRSGAKNKWLKTFSSNKHKEIAELGSKPANIALLTRFEELGARPGRPDALDS
jgi:hypothetical protein